MKKSKIDKEEYLKYYNSYKEDREISEIMGVPYRTISNFRKNILKLPLVQEIIVLTNFQKEVLIGTLLGDSSVLYTHSKCKFPHLYFAHSCKQKEYFYHKFEIFSNVLSSVCEHTPQKTKTLNYHAIGKNVKCLEDYRIIFYPQKEKIIPIDFVKSFFTEVSLAYLFMDDGCKNGDTINLNLQSYSLENLQEFVRFLKDKFNLSFTIKKDRTLYLKHESKEIFYNLIHKYLTKDTKYKLDGLKSSLKSVKQGKP